ncbi:hypothetical protein Fmac_025637 [Flemingia macrophylla]|uniref:GDT1 family protein n=1 Tax=Flemingia macrophylla TaxID=520843 RepID=A0ABD1LSV6_9FABA
MKGLGPHAPLVSRGKPPPSLAVVDALPCSSSISRTTILCPSRCRQKSRLSWAQGTILAQASNISGVEPGDYGSNNEKDDKNVFERNAIFDSSSKVVKPPNQIPYPLAIVFVLLGCSLVFSLIAFLKGGPSSVLAAIAKSGFTAAFTLIFVSEIGDKCEESVNSEGHCLELPKGCSFIKSATYSYSLSASQLAHLAFRYQPMLPTLSYPNILHGAPFPQEKGLMTFFIAALLAMQYEKGLVLLGSMGALALMSILSVVIGRIFQSVPAQFQTKDVRDSHRDHKLRPRSLREFQCQKVICSIDFSFHNVVVVTDVSALCGLPTALPIGEYAAVTLLLFFGLKSIKDAWDLPSDVIKKGDNSSPELDELAEAEELVKEKVSRRLSNPFEIVWKSFSLVFFAEWGDRSMLATIALGAAQSPWGVASGAIAGHLLATSIAILGGAFLANYISEKLRSVSGVPLLLSTSSASLLLSVSASNVRISSPAHRFCSPPLAHRFYSLSPRAMLELRLGAQRLRTTSALRL